MPRKLYDIRTTDLSLYDYVSSSFDDVGFTVLSGHEEDYVPTGIYLIDGFPADPEYMKLPTIAVEYIHGDEQPLQLGPGRTDVRRFEIDVYARTDGERDDLAELTCSFIRKGWINIYDYNVVLVDGFDEALLTRSHAENIMLAPTRFDTNIKAMRHGMRINFDLLITVSSGNSLITI